MAGRETGRAVVVEMPHSWARRELILEWGDWIGERRVRVSGNGVRSRTRAVLANDVACLRWLGHLDDGYLRPRDRLARRESVGVAAWTFVATVLPDTEAIDKATAPDAEDIVEATARELANRLRGCGRLRVLPLAQEPCATGKARATGKIDWSSPAFVRCVDSTLGASWLLCRRPSPIPDLAARRGTALPEICPPLHAIADLHRDPSGSGGQAGPERRQILREYDRRSTGARAEAAASAALVDDLSVTFESAELALGLVKPFDEDCLAAEILLVNPPGTPPAHVKLLACLDEADELARSLAYDVAGALLAASAPLPVLASPLVSSPSEGQPGS